jgi:hypothetical protein
LFKPSTIKLPLKRRKLFKIPRKNQEEFTEKKARKTLFVFVLRSFHAHIIIIVANSKKISFNVRQTTTKVLGFVSFSTSQKFACRGAKQKVTGERKEKKLENESYKNQTRIVRESFSATE